jgi:hypothetical protein
MKIIAILLLILMNTSFANDDPLILTLNSIQFINEKGNQGNEWEFRFKINGKDVWHNFSQIKTQSEYRDININYSINLSKLVDHRMIELEFQAIDHDPSYDDNGSAKKIINLAKVVYKNVVIPLTVSENNGPYVGSSIKWQLTLTLSRFKF